jgi:hypothetical protein
MDEWAKYLIYIAMSIVAAIIVALFAYFGLPLNIQPPPYQILLPLL